MTATQFWSHWLWPFATAVLGYYFSYLVFRQYIERHKYHQLAWFVGLFLYASAAAMEAYSEFVQNWNPAVYRIYIVFAASLVGFLGLGSLYLVFRRKLWGHLFLSYLVISIITFFYGALTVRLDETKLIAGVTVGGSALGDRFSFPRVCSFLFNIPGTTLLLGAAVYSIILFAAKKEYSFRVWANVLIALGTIVIAIAGAMAHTGRTVGLYPAEMVGSGLLLWGFLKAGTLRKEAAREASQ